MEAQLIRFLNELGYSVRSSFQVSLWNPIDRAITTIFPHGIHATAILDVFPCNAAQPKGYETACGEHYWLCPETIVVG